MKKKITAFCSVLIVVSVCVAAFGANGAVKTDVTTATAKVFYAENEESTTSSLGGVIGDVVGGIGDGSSGLGDSLGNLGNGSLGDSLGGIGSGSSGGIGDAIGGIGDALGGIGDGFGDLLGGILGGASQNTTAAPVQTTSADIGLIIPVPAATQNTTQLTESNTAEADKSEGETVDFAVTSNPYKKPTATYSAGDKDDGIKWLQWIFIYTHYGLKDDGITGVLDEDTVAIVKKLQHEKGLTVDGNITEDVIKAAEVLYYQSVLGDDVSAIEISSQATTGVNVSYESVETEKGADVPVALLIIVLVIVWILAIGGIVLLFVFKKRKITSEKVVKNEIKENSEPTKNDSEKISSIADLFDEANKDNK